MIHITPFLVSNNKRYENEQGTSSCRLTVGRHGIWPKRDDQTIVYNNEYVELQYDEHDQRKQPECYDGNE